MARKNTEREREREKKKNPEWPPYKWKVIFNGI